jgi:hypothetical protein
MLCPLLVIANCSLAEPMDVETDYRRIECRKTECAWYCEVAKKCAVKSLSAIAINLCVIANTLDEEEET